MESAGIKTLLSWVSEAQGAHSDWRRQSWEDYEFRDGRMWSPAAFKKLQDKGINPLTINRIFPILNLLSGHFIKNQQDIIAKGRSAKDNELGQVASEALAYVKDRNRGRELLSAAFNDEITAGFGCIQVGKNNDPREEPVLWTPRPWYSCWWDPYASPWLDKEACRYFFSAGWKNLEDVQMVFPEKKKELDAQFQNLSSNYYVPDFYDPGTEVEEYHKYLSSNQWVNTERKRVRPIEMWYTQITKGWFAIMEDSRVIDLDTLKTPQEQFQVVQFSRELITANVKKMRVATFVSDLLLQDVPSPYAHDKYPFVPFVGYLDRFNCPFGIPRQIKEQSMEVNKRRSMALSLISNRRVIIEEDAAEDLNKVYDEANRQDGLIVLRKNRKNSFEIQEMAALAAPQINLMEQSEREIQEIVGANDEALARNSALQSGVALDKKNEMSASVTLSLLENASYSQQRLGELTLAMIQSEWTGPKVLRITDRMSGAEKFVEVNQKVYDEHKGAIVVQNNITEAGFDIVIASAPITDTMREKNMELLFSAINKAPAEAVGPLLNMAFEISDIPNKDALLKQVRAATGLPVNDDTLSKAEQDANALQAKMDKDAADAAEADMQRREREINILVKAAQAKKYEADAESTAKDAARGDWETGYKLGQDILKAQTEEKA